jgi:hypothetical protein
MKALEIVLRVSQLVEREKQHRWAEAIEVRSDALSARGNAHDAEPLIDVACRANSKRLAIGCNQD